VRYPRAGGSLLCELTASVALNPGRGAMFGLLAGSVTLAVCRCSRSGSNQDIWREWIQSLPGIRTPECNSPGTPWALA